MTLAGSNGVAITTTPATDTVTFAPTYGSSANTVCQGNDSRLSDARTPTAHATSHKSGGADAIKLDELAAPTDVTTLNASTAAHGLMPKGDGNAVHFYNGALNQVAPPYDILCGIVGKPSNGEVVLLFVAPRAFRIPANAAGSYLKAGTAATGSSVFSIQKNGTQFLTATVAASGTTATLLVEPDRLRRRRRAEDRRARHRRRDARRHRHHAGRNPALRIGDGRATEFLSSKASARARPLRRASRSRRR